MPKINKKPTKLKDDCKSLELEAGAVAATLTLTLALTSALTALRSGDIAWR